MPSIVQETLMNAQEIDRITEALGEETDIYGMAVAKIYSTQAAANKWTWVTGLEGALVFQSCQGPPGLYFRLLSLPDGKVLWEHELYFDFLYRIDCGFFHSFESDNGIQFGFLFASESEARRFAKAVEENIEMVERRREGSIRSVDSGTGKTRKDSFFGSLFSRPSKEETTSTTKGKKVKQAHELTADDIGDPEDFRHLAHIGFNATTGTFDEENIPDDWKEVFKKAGITKKQLRNKDTAGFIADFVKSNVPAPAPASKKKGPPPPPPAKSIRSAPPPPPRRSSTNVATMQSPPPPAPPAPDPPAPAIEEEEAPKQKSPSVPSIDPGRAQLLASIRGAGIGALKHVDASASPPSGSRSPLGDTSASSGDLMASMLAKALAERNKKMRHSDSDSDEGKDKDSDW